MTEAKRKAYNEEQRKHGYPTIERIDFTLSKVGRAINRLHFLNLPVTQKVLVTKAAHETWDVVYARADNILKTRMAHHSLYQLKEQCF